MKNNELFVRLSDLIEAFGETDKVKDIKKYTLDEILQEENVADFGSKVEEILGYLNSAIGAQYKTTTQKNRTLIRARLREGFTVDDFKTVIDKKSRAWLGDERMQVYLRPETLFGTKFEGYLNEQETYKFTGNKQESTFERIQRLAKEGAFNRD